MLPVSLQSTADTLPDSFIPVYIVSNIFFNTMFIKRKYEMVNSNEDAYVEMVFEDAETSLPAPVLCSALTSSLHQQQEEDVPVLFSSLASSILQDRRERMRRTRRRHNAEIQTPGREDRSSPDELMEPLCSLVLEDNVEMRTLLEDTKEAEKRTNTTVKSSRKRTISSNLNKVSQASAISSKVTKNAIPSLCFCLTGYKINYL